MPGSLIVLVFHNPIRVLNLALKVVIIVSIRFFAAVSVIFKFRQKQVISLSLSILLVGLPLAATGGRIYIRVFSRSLWVPHPNRKAAGFSSSASSTVEMVLIIFFRLQSH